MLGFCSGAIEMFDILIDCSFTALCAGWKG